MIFYMIHIYNQNFFYLSSFSENGGGDINTEDKTVCCEGEADPWQHNPDLKCYIQKSHLKLALPVTIPGEGIPG